MTSARSADIGNYNRIGCRRDVENFCAEMRNVNLAKRHSRHTDGGSLFPVSSNTDVVQRKEIYEKTADSRGRCSSNTDKCRNPSGCPTCSSTNLERTNALQSLDGIGTSKECVFASNDIRPLIQNETGMTALDKVLGTPATKPSSQSRDASHDFLRVKLTVASLDWERPISTDLSPAGW